MDLDRLRESTEHALSRLRGLAGDDDLANARQLTQELRDQGQHALLASLAEAISRQAPDDARNRRLYAQALIEQGCATVAVDVLKPLAARLNKSDPEYAEATGLLGRAYKQIFFDAGDKSGKGARAALKQALAIYRRPFEENPANTWHGVNVLALLTRARRIGLRLAPGLDTEGLARRIIAQLQAVPENDRNEWHLPTLAEASLGLNDWNAVESALRGYVADDAAQAFQIGSTLRQFTQVWDIESTDNRGRALVNILRARLLDVTGGSLTLSGHEVRAARQAEDPEEGQLEAILGPFGAKTWTWWKTGLERAAAVGCVRSRMGERLGTGWLVRAQALGRSPGDELLLVTNEHVISASGATPSITPDAAEVLFEAAQPGKAFGMSEIVWSSPRSRHDCTVLRLAEPVRDIEPLPLAKVLPSIEQTARVYVIGHPGGRELAFSLQDNELLDHEGPPAGKPAIEGLCRVHYRAPTEGGSSGSPVFNASSWQVIALHHKGGKVGMPCLNGKPGTYGANEGIGLESILAAMA